MKLYAASIVLYIGTAYFYLISTAAGTTDSKSVVAPKSGVLSHGSSTDNSRVYSQDHYQYHQFASHDNDIRRRTWVSQDCSEPERVLIRQTLNGVARWARLARRAASQHRRNAFDNERLVHYFAWRPDASQPTPASVPTIEERRRQIVFTHYSRIEQQTSNVGGRGLVQCKFIPAICAQSPLPTMYTNVYTDTISIVSNRACSFGTFVST